MNFLINDGVIYRDDDGAIWQVDAPENVTTLPTTAARILTYLLQNANSNQVISREDIFEHIWSQHGLQASNNTLNQYISLIRKTLLELQCEEEVIKTVPRLGFLISADVKTTEDQHIIHENAYHEVDAVSKSTLLKDRKRLRRLISFAVLLFSFLLIGDTLYELLIQSRYKLNTAQIEKIGSVKHCPVYTFYKSSPKQFQLKVDRVAKLSEQYNLSCIENSIFYFHIENMFNDSSQLFLSRCTLVNGDMKQISGCITIYDGGYRNEK